MKMLNRTIISILRRPYHSLLMFAIVFVLGNVLFASIAVKQSSDSVKKEMRARIPSYIILKDEYYIYDTEAIKQIEKLIENLDQNENVRFVNAIDLTYMYYLEEMDENSVYYDKDNPNFWVSVELSGIRSLDESVFNYEIEEGRFYTEDELKNGDRKIVLNYYSRIQNGKKLEIGDKFYVSIYDYEVVQEESGAGYRVYVDDKKENLEKFEFEIIGFYSERTIKDQYKDLGIEDFLFYDEVSAACINEMIEVQNQILANHSEGDQMMFQQIGSTNLARITYPLIQIGTRGMDATEQLTAELKGNKDWPRSNYSINSSSDDYRYVQAPLENLEALANVALIASAVLVVVLLSLVSILFIRNRMHEIGIYLSVGERKYKILGQFVCEILLVGLLASSLSMVSGNLLGKKISSEFMRIQIDVDSESKYQEANPDALTQLDMLDSYKVELNGQYIVTIFSSSVLILLLSSAAPMLYILRLDPKKILM